ncbi:MAG TPA: PLP-dependent transferase, partial [Actinotalea sp.]|nr:PLP-dependent transferase [Actinotalea sp.]
GLIGAPFDSYLTLRGLRTLDVRMQRHSQNAERVAHFLLDHPAGRSVAFPGLPEHPGHEVAARQMTGWSGMVSARLTSAQAAVETVGRTRLFTLAESLGGVESLIEVPALMTHASVAGSDLAVPEDLVRLSVGLEDVEDLIEDLDQAPRD